MREALNKWLKKQNIDLSIDTTHSLCNSLGLDGEKIDECLGLCYQLEKGNINEADFTSGLGLLTGKKPEEVAEVLRGMKASPTEIRKEPWQMTKEEFVKIYIDRFKRMLSKEALSRVTEEELETKRQEAIEYQKHTIEQALRVGKPVPPEVLEDYPDLRRLRSEPKKD